MADIVLTKAAYSLSDPAAFSQITPSLASPNDDGSNKALEVSMNGQGPGTFLLATITSPSIMGAERYQEIDARYKKGALTNLIVGGAGFKDALFAMGLLSATNLDETITTLISINPPTGFDNVVVYMNPLGSSMEDVWVQHRFWGMIEGSDFRYVAEVDIGDGIWRRVADYLVEGPVTPNATEMPSSYGNLQGAAENANVVELNAFGSHKLTDAAVPYIPATPPAIEDYFWTGASTFQERMQVAAQDGDKPAIVLKSAVAALDQPSASPLEITQPNSGLIWFIIPTLRGKETRWDVYIRLVSTPGGSVNVSLYHATGDPLTTNGYQAAFDISATGIGVAVYRMVGGVSTFFHSESFVGQPGYSYTPGEWVKLSLMITDNASVAETQTEIQLAAGTFTSALVADPATPANWLVPRNLTTEISSGLAGNVFEMHSVKRHEL